MATSKNYGKKKVRITSGIFWTLMGKNPIMEKSDAGAACLSWTFFFFPIRNSVGYHKLVWLLKETWKVFGSAACFLFLRSWVFEKRSCGFNTFQLSQIQTDRGQLHATVHSIFTCWSWRHAPGHVGCALYRPICCILRSPLITLPELFLLEICRAQLEKCQRHESPTFLSRRLIHVNQSCRRICGRIWVTKVRSYVDTGAHRQTRTMHMQEYNYNT